ncbi:MAG: TolC family protein [Kiritimatiellae bacterium]|nr:TolC family protein [Kiritimatiellia bacterium]
MAAACAFAFCGCEGVHRARMAQRDSAAAASGEASAVGSAAVDVNGFGLEKLVAFAVTNRPEAVAAELAARDARLALKQLAADAPVLSDGGIWHAPHLSVSGGYEASSETARHPENLEANTRGGASAGLSLDLLLWDWGRYDASAKAQAERVIAAELELADVRNSVFEEVSSAYFTLMEKDSLLEVAFTNEFEYAEHLRRAEDRLKAGEAIGLDVLRARMDLSRARQNTVAASNDVAVAFVQFMRSLGIDCSPDRRDGVFAARESPLLAAVRGFPDTSFDAASAFALAMADSPAICTRRARLRAAIADVDYAVADLKPSLNASVSLRWTDPVWLWNWGVNGVQSLFLGRRKQLALERAVVAMQIAGSGLAQTERDIMRDIEIAVAERDNAREAMASAASSIRQAAENLRTVERQYGLGDVSRIEFADSVTGYVDALGGWISAFYRGQRAEAAIFPLVGQSPVFAEETVLEDER